MKPTIKASWSISLLRLLAALSCFCLAAAWLETLAVPSSIAHITTAQMLVTGQRPFSPPSSTIEADTLAGTWTTVDLPHPFDANLAPPASVSGEPIPMSTTWYRLSLEGRLPQGKTTHLYLVRWQALGQITIYGDGHLLHRSIGAPAWNFLRNSALLIPLNQTAEVPPPKQILIRIDNVPGSTGSISSLYASDTDTLYTRYWMHDWLENQLILMGHSAFLAVGIFSLAVWLFGRREPLYILLIAIATLATVRRWQFFLALDKLPISDQWLAWIALNAPLWQIIFLHHFLVLLHGYKRPWLSVVLFLFALAVSCITLPWLYTQLILSVLNLKLFFSAFAVAFVVISFNALDAWRSRSQEARLLVAWIFIAMLLAMHDFLHKEYQTNMEGIYLLPLAPIGLFAVMMYIIFRRYLGAIGEVERVNAGLAQRLQDREDALKISHERLREIGQREVLSQERQRLMQDMHDGLGSSLITALRKAEHGRMDEAELAQVLKGCIDDLKLAIDSMEPVEADLLLLLATFRYRLGPRLESTGIKLCWEVNSIPDLDWLNPNSALHILRILQEAFTNIIKHTHASEIRVATRAEKDHVVVTVSDNGQGFSVADALKSGGKGLSNQMRRAQSISGEIGWEFDDSGTHMSLRLPVNPKRE